MNKNVTWKELKALDDLYRFKKTKANIQEHPYIKFLLDDMGILDRKIDNIKVIIATDDFEKFYDDVFKIQYEEAKYFLLENGIEASAKKNFTL